VKLVVDVSAPVDSVPPRVLLPLHPSDAVHEVAFVEVQVRVDAALVATDVGLAVSVIVGGGTTVTVAVWLTLPPTPEHTSVKLVVVVNAPVDWLPPVVLVPVQPPDALQAAASVEVHVSIDEPPLATAVGCASSVTVGGGTTLTVADWLPLPPGPEHVSMKVVVAVSAPVDCVPLRDLVPLQPSEAVQVEALVTFHVRVDDPPVAMDVGLAVSDTEGVALTVTVTVCWALPPGPVHVSMKLVVAVSAPVDCVPTRGRLPLHPSDAVHEVASVELQTSIDDPPLATLVGLAVSAIDGGGRSATVAVWLALPPVPEHVSV
jgi:hypothetical protein